MAENGRSFEQVWPDLSGRLERVLRRRHVPDQCVDDVVQETGLRLLRKWGTVDQATVWALTLTVAGNIIKDDMRRRIRDERHAEALTADYVDIEERAIARVELWKTQRAIEALNAAQRTALLSEVYGYENTLALSKGAAKMSRLRARRALRQALGRASGLVALTGHRLRRLVFGDTRVAFEAVSHTAAAALLIAAGVDLAILSGGMLSPTAEGQLVGPTTLSSSNGEEAASVVSNRSLTIPSARAARPSFATAAPRVNGTSGGGEEVLRHGSSVGTDGANGWVTGHLQGHRAEVEVDVRREPGECAGPSTEISALCLGGPVRAEVIADHNGKRYHTGVTSAGDVWVASRPRRER